MRRLLACMVCAIVSDFSFALDQARFDADVCVITNEILNGWNRHVRDTVYSMLDGFQQYRNLSDEDFTRELLFIASVGRRNGSETEREWSRKTSVWRQTMLYLGKRNVPLKESVDFYEEVLRNGIEDEMAEALHNYIGQMGYTPEYFEKIDIILADKERRKDSTHNTLLYSMKCDFYHKIFWSRPPISNVVSNRIVEYMEKSVRKDSVRAGYFLETLCKAKPEFKDSDEWFERVCAIIADETLTEYLRKPYRDQLREAEKRRQEKEDSKK